MAVTDPTLSAGPRYARARRPSGRWCPAAV